MPALRGLSGTGWLDGGGLVRKQAMRSGGVENVKPECISARSGQEGGLVSGADDCSGPRLAGREPKSPTGGEGLSAPKRAETRCEDCMVLVCFHCGITMGWMGPGGRTWHAAAAWQHRAARGGERVTREARRRRGDHQEREERRHPAPQINRDDTSARTRHGARRPAHTTLARAARRRPGAHWLGPLKQRQHRSAICLPPHRPGLASGPGRSHPGGGRVGWACVLCWRAAGVWRRLGRPETRARGRLRKGTLCWKEESGLSPVERLVEMV